MAPRTPAGLETQGKKFWNDTVKAFDLRAHELSVLEDICREVDTISRIEKELKTADLMVKGSMGQPIANDLLREIRQHRMAKRTLIAALKLPDEDLASQSRSTTAREAANARWRRGQSA